MSTSPSGQRRDDARDPVRELAFDALYALGGDAASADEAARALDELSADARTRALNIAGRRLAFQLMYELDQSRPVDSKDARAKTKAALSVVPGLGPVAAEFIEDLVVGAYEARVAADAEFSRLSPEWPAHRQPAVDRAILRLTHWELTLGRTPPKLVLSEAVELARHFSTDKSPAFVNGLLDKVYRRIHPEG
jgi:N utilization substance protein B